MAQRLIRRRRGSGILMTLGVLVAMLGVVGMGPTSSATDTPPADVGDWQPQPAAETPASEPPTTKPPVVEPEVTVPNADPKPTTPEPSTPTSASTTAKARVSCPDAAILVDLMNSGETAGTYTLTFTPDGSNSTTKVTTVEPGVNTVVSIPIVAGTTGTLDIRSSSDVVMDARRITSKCAAPRGAADARADCAAKQLLVTVRNDGNADGIYAVSFTPDGLDAVVREVLVPAGQTVTESIATSTPFRGTLDVRSDNEVLIDHRTINEPCSAPNTTGDARFDCVASQLVVTLRNNGTAPGTYTLSYTPDGGTAATTSALVPARSEAVFALAVTPPRGGQLDVRSGAEIVIGGRRIEVNCATTTTVAPTTVAPTAITPTTVAPTTIAVTVAPATSIGVAEPPHMLAATGSSSSLTLVGVGMSMFILGLITLELRSTPAPPTSRRR